MRTCLTEAPATIGSPTDEARPGPDGPGSTQTGQTGPYRARQYLTGLGHHIGHNEPGPIRIMRGFGQGGWFSQGGPARGGPARVTQPWYPREAQPVVSQSQNLHWGLWYRATHGTTHPTHPWHPPAHPGYPPCHTTGPATLLSSGHATRVLTRLMSVKREY